MRHSLRHAALLSVALATMLATTATVTQEQTVGFDEYIESLRTAHRTGRLCEMLRQTYDAYVEQYDTEVASPYFRGANRVNRYVLEFSGIMAKMSYLTGVAWTLPVADCAWISQEQQTLHRSFNRLSPY